MLRRGVTAASEAWTEAFASTPHDEELQAGCAARSVALPGPPQADRRAAWNQLRMEMVTPAVEPRAARPARVVGSVGLCQGKIAGGAAVDDPGEIDHPQGIRTGEDEEPDAGANLADQEHRLAPDPIRPVADQWSRDQLADRKRQDEQRRLQRCGLERLGVDRQERQDQRHADDVDQDNQEDRQQRNTRAGLDGRRSGRKVFERVAIQGTRSLSLGARCRLTHAHRVRRTARLGAGLVERPLDASICARLLGSR